MVNVYNDRFTFNGLSHDIICVIKTNLTVTGPFQHTCHFANLPLFLHDHTQALFLLLYRFEV